MASEIIVNTIKAPTTGANANKVIIPSGVTLDASAGTLTPSAGQIIQVKFFESSTSAGQLVTTSTSGLTASGVFVDFTPKNASSLIIVRADLQSKNDAASNTSDGLVMLVYRDGGARLGVGGNGDAFWHNSGVSQHNQHFQMSFAVSELANNTTSRRYEVYFRSFGGNPAGINYDWGAQTMTVMEIAQ